MNKIEKASSLIASVFLAVIIVYTAPFLYTGAGKILQLPYLTDQELLFAKAKEKLEPMRYAGDIEEIESNLSDPAGILRVKSKIANVRSSSDVVENNIIGDVKQGQHLLFYDTVQNGDTVWYMINHNGDEGWISAVTLDVLTESPEQLEGEDLDRVSKFMGEYSSASMNALETKDFSIAEPYLDPKGPQFKEQQKYMNYLIEKQISEENLAFEVIDTIRMADGKIWVRTVEFYDIKSGDGITERKDFVSEYLLTVSENSELKVHRLLGSTQQN